MTGYILSYIISYVAPIIFFLIWWKVYERKYNPKLGIANLIFFNFAMFLLLNNHSSNPEIISTLLIIELIAFLLFAIYLLVYAADMSKKIKFTEFSWSVVRYFGHPFFVYLVVVLVSLYADFGINILELLDIM